jgi:hypothetical protein
LSDDLYAKAAFDYLFVAYIMALVEQSQGTEITTELVVARAEHVKALLQSESPVSAVVMRDVPEGMEGYYRSAIGAVHDRGLVIFEALLAS